MIFNDLQFEPDHSKRCFMDNWQDRINETIEILVNDGINRYMDSVGQDEYFAKIERSKKQIDPDTTETTYFIDDQPFLKFVYSIGNEKLNKNPQWTFYVK